MTIFLLVLCFAIGALFGSFITALVWRTRNGRSMMEAHSVCPDCQHPLGPLDLVPILSYLLQRGRCRYCRKHISAQYPLIEVSTAILFSASAWWVAQASGVSQQVSEVVSSLDVLLLHPWVLVSIVFVWAMLVLLIAMFIYDWRWGELPNRWTIGGSIIALIMTILAVVLGQPLLWQPNFQIPSTVADLCISIAAGVIAMLFFFAIVVISEKILHKPGMGMGDVKLALLMGVLLGFPGIVVALYLAFILGAVLSLVLISTKRKQMGMAIPFGPFMVGGTILAWWVTPIAITWYQQFLS